MKIPIVGPAYRARSPNMAADTCINLYPEVSEIDGNVRALYGTPGLRRLVTLPNTGGVRAVFAPAVGKLIVVQGDKVYRVDGRWNVTPCPGTLLTTKGPISIAENGTIAVIVDGNNGYLPDIQSRRVIVFKLALNRLHVSIIYCQLHSRLQRNNVFSRFWIASYSKITHAPSPPK